MFGIKFPKIFGPGAQELVCVEFDDGNLKIAHARSGIKRNEIIGLVSRDIAAVPEGNIPAVIDEAVRALKAKNPYVVYSIPSNFVITKNIEVPSTDPREIRDIINLQAGRHTPYSREEIMVDYVEIGTYKNSYTRILLVIVARSVVKKYFDMMEKARIRLQKIFFAPESLSLVLPGMLKLDTVSAPVGIAHVDGALTDFIVISKNKPIFVRSVPIGAKHLIESRERYEAKFAEEIKRSLEAYSGENIEAAPGLVVFTGAVEEIRGMMTVLSTAINLPLKAMSYSESGALSNDMSKAASLAKGVSFLNVIVPLIALKEMKIDLVPEEAKLRKSLEERGRQLIATGVLILMTILFFSVIVVSNIFFKSVYLKTLNARYENVETEARKLEKDFTQLQLVKKYLLNQGYPLETLTELYRTIPADVELSDIRFEREGKFSVRGTASSMSSVFAFVDALEKSSYFKDVKTKYTTRRKEGTVDVTDFEITATLEKELG